MLSEKNIRYFQLLDLIKLIDEIPIDNKHPETILKKFAEIYDLDLDKLITYTNKHYEKNVLETVVHFVNITMRQIP